MKSPCARAEAARRCVAVRTRAAPPRQILPARAGSVSRGTLRGLARRAVYFAILIAVPGSLLLLAAWQWLAHRRRAAGARVAAST